MPWHYISGGSALEGGEKMDDKRYQGVTRRQELIERYKQIMQARRELFEMGCAEHKLHTQDWWDRIAICNGELMALREMISKPAPVGSIGIETVRKATPAEMENAPRRGNSGGANSNKTQCQYTP